jgi:hypothetical protein
MRRDVDQGSLVRAFYCQLGRYRNGFAIRPQRPGNTTRLHDIVSYIFNLNIYVLYNEKRKRSPGPISPFGLGLRLNDDLPLVFPLLLPLLRGF